MHEIEIKKTEKLINNAFTTLCVKSKKICAICETVLRDQTDASGYGRIVISSVVLTHPKFKSKKYKICGNCYLNFRKKER